jgi:hypothetical protein
MKPNAWQKIAAAIAAVLALSAPSAVGVYRALEPTRGSVAAGLAAAGFELAYLSLSLLTLRPELRRQARQVALGAVATAITLNVLADYGARVAGGLASWPEAVRLFDPLALSLALLESAPLAGLAYALASLLHRLAEEPATAVAPPADPAPALAWAREGYPLPIEEHATTPLELLPELLETAINTDGVAGNSSNTPGLRCRHCGAEGLTKSEQLMHGRQHARERRTEEQSNG